MALAVVYSYSLKRIDLLSRKRCVLAESSQAVKPCSCLDVAVLEQFSSCLEITPELRSLLICVLFSSR